jgi:nicotinate-nucleotide pyrophosphorylase (carboxylating)
MTTTTMPLPTDISSVVRQALAEDIGRGDLSAALVPHTHSSTATIISREPALLCGRPWVEQVFRQLDADIQLNWHADDGPWNLLWTLADRAQVKQAVERHVGGRGIWAVQNFVFIQFKPAGT